MQVVSNPYNIAVRQSNRSSSARIFFQVVDIGAAGDATPTANNTQPFTSINSVLEDQREPDFLMGTFEPDYFKLDGSMYLMPDDITPATDNIGWWGPMSSNANNLTNAIITFTFSGLHSSLGIGLFFGSDEYPSMFEIIWYRGSTVLLDHTESNNASREYSLDIPVENYDKIQILFYKTKNPFRYVRLQEIAFGLEQVFTDDNITAANIVEEVDPSGSTLSINTLSFTVLNEDQRFNMLNSEGIYGFLQKRQRIKAQSGLMLGDGSYEYVSMGSYYLSNWKNSTGITATLEATDLIGLLDKTTYSASPFWVNEPITNVILHILNDSGGLIKFNIASDVASEKVNGYIGVKSHREALQDVLVSTRSVLRIDRNDTISIFRINYLSAVEEINNEAIIGSPTIEQLALITAVEATEYTYQLGTVGSSIHNSTFNVIGTQTVLITFDNASINVSVNITGSGVITGTKISAITAQVTIQGTGSITLQINGTPYLESKRSVTSSLGVLLAGETPQTATLSDANKLIVGNAALVSQHILDYHQYRVKQTFEYWDNPAIQSGDVVDIETMFTKFSSGVVERQEITFAPNLKGRLEVIG